MAMNQLTPEQQEAKRQYNREAKRRQRAKQAEDDPETLRICKIEEEGQKYHGKLGYCFFGEDRPGHDADTIESALAMCREFARLLGVDDIQPGESLYDFELRVGKTWCEQGGPFLNRTQQKLYPGWGNDYWTRKPFEEMYTPLAGAKEPIDIAGLPPLPDIPRDISAYTEDHMRRA